MTTNQPDRMNDEYLSAYNRARKALDAIDAAIHDLPAPESEPGPTWGSVAEMQRIARQLEELTPHTL